MAKKTQLLEDGFAQEYDGPDGEPIGGEHSSATPSQQLQCEDKQILLKNFKSSLRKVAGMDLQTKAEKARIIFNYSHNKLWEVDGPDASNKHIVFKTKKAAAEHYNCPIKTWDNYYDLGKKMAQAILGGELPPPGFEISYRDANAALLVVKHTRMLAAHFEEDVKAQIATSLHDIDEASDAIQEAVKERHANIGKSGRISKKQIEKRNRTRTQMRMLELISELKDLAMKAPELWELLTLGKASADQQNEIIYYLGTIFATVYYKFDIKTSERTPALSWGECKGQDPEYIRSQNPLCGFGVKDFFDMYGDKLSQSK